MTAGACGRATPRRGSPRRRAIRTCDAFRTRRIVWIAVVATAIRGLEAQSFRARLDATAQHAEYRGLQADSLDRALAVAGPGGALFTPDGERLRCGAGSQCHFFRAGPRFGAAPISVNTSVTAWGLGIPGLAVRGTARLTTDLGGDEALPTLGPFAQVLEGYLEYTVNEWRLRGGRQLLMSRLEPLGFDGVAATWRLPRRAMELGAYAGWGLDRASSLPITDPALDPLDEWRPRRRQVVAGIEGAWSPAFGELRGEYRREVDPVADHFVSERATLSGTLHAHGIRASAGFDYDLVEGRFGSGDLTVTRARPRYTVATGVRRYRPYFSLWTLWGAFSPVGFDAAFASASVQPLERLTIRGRAERFAYDPVEISTGLVPRLTSDGWRLGTSATVSLSPRVTIEGGLDLDTGPGANGRTAEFSVDFAPVDALRIGVHAGSLRRPLELRYFDAVDRWVGGRVEWALRPDRRAWLELVSFEQERERPDAADSRLKQARVRTGVSLTLGTAADRQPLPPAVRPLR